jgi:hypothetical protein
MAYAAAAICSRSLLLSWEVSVHIWPQTMAATFTRPPFAASALLQETDRFSLHSVHYARNSQPSGFIFELLLTLNRNKSEGQMKSENLVRVLNTYQSRVYSAFL